ncbi:serine/threonine protein kinase [bacterium]|nr:serine/threonine protein kinase [bacterium]
MSGPTRFQVSGQGPAFSSGFGLPGDLLRESRKRVRTVALLVLIASTPDFVLTVGQGVVALLSPKGELPQAIPFAYNILTLASAIAMMRAARSARIGDGTLLNLALAFEVFLCLILSMANPDALYQDTGALPRMTWVTPLIILFPLIVPCPPRRTLLAAILSATMRPIGLLLLVLGGRVEAGAEDFLVTVFSPTVAVVFAYYGSRVVYGLGIQVADARRMGNYTLESKLGSGGMGEVWLARHRLLARPAAVKLIHSGIGDVLGSPEASVVLHRFEREAQATAALRSPHTIQLYDFGVSEDGKFYYVMELLDGLDADTLVRRFGPLPAERVVAALRQACHSLAEAHESGLTHRDVKPANLHFCRYGRDYDFVKVLDFGLVKTSATGGAVAPTLTADGIVSGTPAFMAPEQARGEDGVDARSDLYALGCVAYWLLTGQLVFEGKSAVEMLMHHIQTTPEPPSARTEIPVPGELDRIVLACLEKDPAKRPQSATELSRRLAECPLPSAWTNERAREWWGVHHPVPAAPPAPEQAGATRGA